MLNKHDKSHLLVPRYPASARVSKAFHFVKFPRPGSAAALVTWMTKTFHTNLICATFILSDNHVVYMDDQLIISCLNIQVIWYCERKLPVRIMLFNISGYLTLWFTAANVQPPVGMC